MSTRGSKRKAETGIANDATGDWLATRSELIRNSAFKAVGDHYWQYEGSA